MSRSALVLALLALAACSSDGGSGSSGAVGGGERGSGPGGPGAGGAGGSGPGASSGGSAAGATLRTRVRAAASPASGQQSLSAQGVQLGAAKASDLASLKYFVQSIVICEEMSPQGSGSSPGKGCLEIYRGKDDPRFAYELGKTTDFTPIADAARETDEGFVDLMDPAAREKLGTSTKLTPGHAHPYSWGAVYWNLPIKVKARIPMSDGSTWYTHDGATVRTTMGDGYVAYPTVTTTSLLEGPESEAVVLHSNGGAWFRFQAPLVVREEDVAEGKTFVLDLAFDPDGLVKGASPGGGPSPSLQDDQQRGISVPMLDLTPVPHAESETVVRETYEAQVASGGESFRFRVSLYGLAGDAARTVYGVSMRTLPTAGTLGAVSDAQKISFVETKDGKLEMQAWDRSAVLRGFTRGEKEGDETTATLSCARWGSMAAPSAGVVFDGCADGDLPVTFRLVSVGAP